MLNCASCLQHFLDLFYMQQLRLLCLPWTLLQLYQCLTTFSLGLFVFFFYIFKQTPFNDSILNDAFKICFSIVCVGCRFLFLLGTGWWRYNWLIYRTCCNFKLTNKIHEVGLKALKPPRSILHFSLLAGIFISGIVYCPDSSWMYEIFAATHATQSCRWLTVLYF